MKIIGVIVLGLILLVGGGMLMNVLLFPVNSAQKEVDIAYDSQDKVLNADNAIYNYEWFKQKKADIDAAKKQLDNSRNSYSSFQASAGTRSTWTFEDKQEDSRLRSIVLGQENYVQGLIGDYNAKASMATRNIFQDRVLPNYIDALTFIRK